MGIISDLAGLNDLIFGSSTEGEVSTSGGTSAKEIKSSGSTDTTKTVNSGSTDITDQIYANTVENSGSKNVITTGPSSSTTTTKEQVNTSQLLLSQDAVNHIVKGILEGTSGLAATTSAQNQSGAYNSTTTQLLTNDLLSRTAGEVAARSAMTKTVIGGTESTTNNSGNTVTQDIGGSTTVNKGNTYTTAVKGGSTSTSTTDHGAATITETSVTSPTSTKTGSHKDGLLDNLGWIICSELYRQGRMNKKHFIAGLRKFRTYDERILQGYYIWAVPSTRLLRNKPDSLYSKFLAHIFCSRAKFLAGEGNEYDMVIAGAVHAFCFVLSRTVARKYTAPDYAANYAGV